MNDTSIPVQIITGRRVIGFMSGIDVHNDLSSEVFTREPRTPNGAATED